MEGERDDHLTRMERRTPQRRTISSIYVIIEAGIPATSVAVLYDSALGIMISSQLRQSGCQRANPGLVLEGWFGSASGTRSTTTFCDMLEKR